MAEHDPAVSRWRPVGWLLLGALLLLGGLFAAGRIQSGSEVTVETVRFRGASGALMRALLYRPLSATAARPAPAILAVHGYLNSAEMQSNFAIEYARRGYVVLSPDQRGHGASAPAAFEDGFGGPDALAFLRSLPFVDRKNIGLEGHSMGGWTVLAAARAHPEGYRAMVLEGSSVGAPFAPAGDARFPRNLLVVFGERDEFGGFMWGPEAPLRTGATAKAMALFGTAAPVVPGRTYGDVAAGDARLLETPRMIHPWAHQSATAIGHSISWFARTLDGGRPLPPDDQVWPWKEAAGAVAVAGIAPFLIGLFGVVRLLPLFADLGERDPAQGDGPDIRFRTSGLILLAGAPVLTYLPLMRFAEGAIGQNPVLRQTFTNQLAFWAIVNTAVALGVSGAMQRSWPLKIHRPWRALGLAALVTAGLYLVIAAADQQWRVNPQLWIFAWRPLSLDRARDVLVYAPVFVAFMVVTLQLLDRLLPMASGSGPAAYARTAAVLAGPFALFLALQYGVLAITGALASPEEGLRVIMAILFAPLMSLFAGLAVASRRATGTVLPGALLCGLLLTWFLTATQPIGVG